MSRYLFVAVIWAMIASTLAGPFAAFAQSTAGAGLNEQQAQPKIDRRKLIVPPRNPDGSLITTPFFADPMEWLREKQRDFYGALSGAMRSIKSDAPVAAASMLILLSFGYGIFHAAGPGHGKAVISTWLVATENELRRGILIAFMSAGVQALTAIAIVTVLLLIVSAVGSAARNVADFLQSASFALIGGMGLWLMWSAFRPHGHATQEVAARFGVDTASADAPAVLRRISFSRSSPNSSSCGSCASVTPSVNATSRSPGCSSISASV